MPGLELLVRQPGTAPLKQAGPREGDPRLLRFLPALAAGRAERAERGDSVQGALWRVGEQRAAHCARRGAAGGCWRRGVARVCCGGVAPAGGKRACDASSGSGSGEWEAVGISEAYCWWPAWIWPSGSTALFLHCVCCVSPFCVLLPARFLPPGPTLALAPSAPASCPSSPLAQLRLFVCNNDDTVKVYSLQSGTLVTLVRPLRPLRPLRALWQQRACALRAANRGRRLAVQEPPPGFVCRKGSVESEALVQGGLCMDTAPVTGPCPPALPARAHPCPAPAPRCPPRRCAARWP